MSLCTNFIILGLSYILSKASETTSKDHRRDALCGIRYHTSNTESYFPESTYENGAFDADGNVVYSEFQSYNADSWPKTWTCSFELCKLGPLEQVNATITNIYEKIGECTFLDGRLYVQHMNTCTMMEAHDPTLLGHAKECLQMCASLHCFIYVALLLTTLIFEK